MCFSLPRWKRNWGSYWESVLRMWMYWGPSQWIKSMWYIVKWSRACYWRMKAPLSDSTHLHWDYRVVSGPGAAASEGAVLRHQSVLEGSVNYCCSRTLCPRWVSFFITFLLIFKLGSMSMKTFLTLIIFPLDVNDTAFS